jgi:hypothetical protein
MTLTLSEKWNRIQSGNNKNQRKNIMFSYFHNLSGHVTSCRPGIAVHRSRHLDPSECSTNLTFGQSLGIHDDTIFDILQTYGVFYNSNFQKLGSFFKCKLFQGITFMNCFKSEGKINIWGTYGSIPCLMNKSMSIDISSAGGFRG